MTTRVVSAVIERTYSKFMRRNIGFIITNDLPIHWGVRIRPGDHIKVNMIDTGDSVNSSNTMTKMTVIGINGDDNEAFKVEKTLNANENDEHWFSFDNNGAVAYTIVFRMEIPVNRKEELVIDFKSPEIQHDRILILNGEKFHVNSNYLSVWSKYFETMFSKDFAEKEKKEIPIEEVDPKEFEELLKVIYPTRKEIDASNVAFLWKLADRFDVPSVIHQCEQYLTTSPGFYMLSLEEKFDLLQMVKSEKLEKKCRELMKKMTPED